VNGNCGIGGGLEFEDLQKLVICRKRGNDSRKIKEEELRKKLLDCLGIVGIEIGEGGQMEFIKADVDDGWNCGVLGRVEGIQKEVTGGVIAFEERVGGRENRHGGGTEVEVCMVYEDDGCEF
jgi:hypothetical protein